MIELNLNKIEKRCSKRLRSGGASKKVCVIEYSNIGEI
jgi:hypothetical protein